MNVIKLESVGLLCLKQQNSFSGHLWNSYCYVLPTAGAPKFMLIQEGWILKRRNAINTPFVLAKAFQSLKMFWLVYLLGKFVYFL